LPAIFISAGAGLRIATGLLFPGTLPRRESLVVAGREAVQLVLGCVPMLFIAGIIEAFLSPTELSPGMKFLFAGSVLILLAAYLSGVTVKRATTADSDA